MIREMISSRSRSELRVRVLRIGRKEWIEVGVDRMYG